MRQLFLARSHNSLYLLFFGCGFIIQSHSPLAAPLAQAPATPTGKSDPTTDPGSTANAPDPFADNFQTLLETAVNDTRVKIAVRAVMPGKYIGVLSGKPRGQVALDRARQIADTLAAEVNKSGNLNTLIIVDAMQIGNDAAKNPVVSYHWVFGYLLGDASFDGQQDLTKLAEAFNFLFPSRNGDAPLVILRNNEFWLQGPQSQVQTLRGLLTLIDAPAPQVRLEMWAIQYAGSQQGVGEQLRRVAEDINATKKLVELAQFALVDAVHKHASDFAYDETFQKLRSVGFDIDPAHSLSLIEALLCIGLSNNREVILKDASETLAARLETIAMLDKTPAQIRQEVTRSNIIPEAMPAHAVMLRKDLIFANLKALLSPPVAGESASATLTLSASALRSLASDRSSIDVFTEKLQRYFLYMDALEFYRPTTQTDPQKFLASHPNAPEDLATAVLPINRHIEHLITAFTGDMESMFFQPLLKRAQEAPSLPGGGVGLSGRTRIVVTSRLSASVLPELEAYAEKQVPRTLGSDFIPNLLNSSKAGPKGVATLLPGLTNLEQGLVLAALQPTADVSYYKVAPGISVKVTPAMTPDGTNANLNLDVTFGVETNIAKDSSTDALAYRPPDAVKSHHITTTAAVGGFNLFEVSSFNMDTVTPRSPFIFPVLGNLPLIGNMFRFAHSPNHTFHQSIILTNAILIPRGLGLVNLYGANFAGAKWTDKTSKTTTGKIDSLKFIGK